MEVAERLAILKQIEDKNAAVDEAFIAGVQSVVPMREFTLHTLEYMLEAIRGWNSQIPFLDSTASKKRMLQLSAEIIVGEIKRREISMPCDYKGR